jgi:hypothetical protein
MSVSFNWGLLDTSYLQLSPAQLLWFYPLVALFVYIQLLLYCFIVYILLTCNFIKTCNLFIDLIISLINSILHSMKLKVLILASTLSMNVISCRPQWHIFLFTMFVSSAWHYLKHFFIYYCLTDCDLEPFWWLQFFSLIY